MNSYSYTATDSAGKFQQGVLDAADLTDAIAQLAAQNLSVLSIALRDEAEVSKERLGQNFERNLSQLLAQRHEWITALDAACDELPAGSTRRELQGLSRQLRSTRFDGPLPDLLQNASIIQLLPLLGETGDGTGSQCPLREWLSRMLKQRELRTQQRKRFIYPIVLIGLSLLLLIGFAFFLIPIFRDMFNDFGLSLPAPTLLTFWLAEQATTYLLRTLGILLCALLVFVPVVWYWRNRSLSNRLFGRLVAGTSSNLMAMSSLTGTLAHMLNLGAPLAEALRIAGKASRSYVYELAAFDLSKQIDQSSNLNSSLSSRVLPPSLLFALQAEPGGLPNLQLLQAMSEIYSDRAKCRVDLFTTLMPVFAVVAIGLGVGFVVISLFMPLVSMITSLA